MSARSFVVVIDNVGFDVDKGGVNAETDQHGSSTNRRRFIVGCFSIRKLCGDGLWMILESVP